MTGEWFRPGADSDSRWELESESFLINVNGGISVRMVWNCDEWNSESWWCMIPIPHIYVALIQV